MVLDDNHAARYGASVRIGAMESNSLLCPYDQRWPDEFDRIRTELAGALGSLAESIDHIGSTSIPGMAAKDCIDIQLRCRTLESAAFDTAFANIGFTRSDNEWNRGDHVPRGWQGPSDQWDKLVYGPPNGHRLTNVHVRVVGHANARYALLFRDYLRADALAAAAWGELKQRLASHMPRELDSTYVRERIRAGGPGSAYGWIKDTATDVLIRAAELWAERAAWQPEVTAP